MKRISAGFLLTLVVLFVTVPLHADVQVGKSAPDFTLEDTKGNNHSLSQYRGNYVVLEWLNHDCPFVRKHYDSSNMQNLQKFYAEEGVTWLSINSSAHGKQGHYHPEEANQLTQQKGAAPTAVLMDFDGMVGKMYGAKTTPHMYIINTAGKLIYQGAIDDTPSANSGDIAKSVNYVQKALAEAMGGKNVSIPATKAYGCSVKY